jgi:hypothetical protein
MLLVAMEDLGKLSNCSRTIFLFSFITYAQIYSLVSPLFNLI